MAEFSNYLEDALINAVLRNTSYTSPTTVYVSLYTSDPTDSDSGTEVSAVGTAYARQTVTFAAPTNGVTTNNTDVIFPTATSSWGTVTHIALHDASSGGNLLFHTPLDVAKTIDASDIFKVESGNLSVTLS